MINPIIVLAPHLEFPIRNGGNIYTERLSRYLSMYRTVVLLATNKQMHYEKGTVVEEIIFDNKLRSKIWAAIRTLFFFSHYLVERFNTPAFQRKTKTLLQKYPDASIICSMLSSSAYCNELPLRSKTAILTQNDEILWFQNQRRFSKNLLHKMVAWISENWVRNFLKNEEKRHLFIHITQADFEGFKSVAPTHKGIIVPAGVDIIDLPREKKTDKTIRLVFVGALSVKTNYDSLAFFRKHFWPLLKEKFETKIEFQIAGSNPSEAVYKLAQDENWRIFANLDDIELQALYQNASFSVLAFPYTTGAKLKLLNSLAGGLPVLATQNMLSIPGQAFLPNFYSDSPEEWAAHLDNYAIKGVSQHEREICQKYASQFSWQKITEQFEKSLTELGF